MTMPAEEEKVTTAKKKTASRSSKKTAKAAKEATEPAAAETTDDADAHTLSADDFARILSSLLAQGKKNHGTLTRDEVNAAVSPYYLNEEQMDQVTAYLESKEIDILDMDDTASDDNVSIYDEGDEEDDASREELRQIEEDEKDSTDNTEEDASDYVNTEDPIRMYLKEIGRVKLLTADEEIAVANRIENSEVAQSFLDSGITDVNEENLKAALDGLHLGDYYEEKKDAFLGKSPEDIKEMITDGKDARNFLAESNLRLVVSIAKKYVGRGMSFLDLIQEGNLGLMKAVDKFDYRRGFKFSTYATWWIRQAITRAIADQARTIRIPVHMVETINKLIRITRNLTTELGREPTADEIAKEMGITADKVSEIQQVAVTPVSLDTPVGDEDDSQIGDFISDENSISPADAATFGNLKGQLVECMNSLTERERDVLILRFGLADGKARTLEEVGVKFGVTRERIRQIEAKALRKLRHPSRSKKLRDYLE